MVPLCSDFFLLLLLFWSRLLHAALAMHANLAALGTIFQAYRALCPCEPRRPLGDMQAVSCGARSRRYSRLLPPARNLDVSSREQAQGPSVGFIYRL